MICPEYSTLFTHDRGRETLMGSFEGLSLSDRLSVLSDGHPPSYSLLFFGDQREERGTTAAFDRPMFSWRLGGDDDNGFQSYGGRCFEEEFAAGLTLEELADSHLKSHGLGRKEADCRDDLMDHCNGEELQAKDKCSPCAATNEFSFMAEPSLLGHLLCRKQQRGKTAACTVSQRTCACPQEIKPFNFKSPSPDDLVRASQKGQKRGIRKQLLIV